MTQDAQMEIKSSGAESIVVWSVRGQHSFLGRAMCMFMDMDQMVGGIFEKGLANLKSRLEKNI